MIGLAIATAIAGAIAAIGVFAPLRGAGVPRWAGPVAAAGLLLASGAVYWIGGSPQQEGVPYARAAEERRATDPASLSAEARIERLRDDLRDDTQNAEAWAMLGRELARAGRELEAINAFQRALSLDRQARTFSDLGQTVINLNEGEVTPEARRAFEAARELDPDLPEPGFFLGLGAYQEGDRAAAVDAWADVLERLQPGDPFRTIIARQATELLSRPDVNSEAVSMAAEDDADIPPEERIAGMVARLGERVDSGEGSLSDHLVLMRVRAMMGDMEGARRALSSAEAAYSDSAGTDAILDVARQALNSGPGEE